VTSRFTIHQKCSTPSGAIRYTSRWSSSQRLAPRRRTMALVEVTASGISSSSAVKPTVMNGRLAMSFRISETSNT